MKNIKLICNTPKKKCFVSFSRSNACYPWTLTPYLPNNKLRTCEFVILFIVRPSTTLKHRYWKLEYLVYICTVFMFIDYGWKENRFSSLLFVLIISDYYTGFPNNQHQKWIKPSIQKFLQTVKYHLLTQFYYAL